MHCAHFPILHQRYVMQLSYFAFMLKTTPILLPSTTCPHEDYQIDVNQLVVGEFKFTTFHIKYI
jgi:hypothetical protein